MNQLPEVGLLRLPQVLKIIPVSRASWWAGIRAHRYPAGVKLGPRTTAWHAADIKALVESFK
jgi:prophage regulatory protein